MGKFEGLVVDINLEKQNLARLTSELSELMDKQKGKLGSTEVRAVGSILHDFYTGLEKIFERIALVIDGGFPEGEDWHVQLLRRMFVPVAERRPAVLSDDLSESLNECLRFRHLFRNIYGFELKWERCQELAQKLPSVFEEIDQQLSRFTNFLSKI